MENERECSICKSVKSIEEFIRDNRKKTCVYLQCFGISDFAWIRGLGSSYLFTRMRVLLSDKTSPCRGYAASCKHCHRLSQRGAVAERCGVTDARLCKGCGIVKPPVEFNKLALVAGPDGLCR